MAGIRRRLKWVVIMGLTSLGVCRSGIGQRARQLSVYLFFM